MAALYRCFPRSEIRPAALVTILKRSNFTRGIQMVHNKTVLSFCAVDSIEMDQNNVSKPAHAIVKKRNTPAINVSIPVLPFFLRPFVFFGLARLHPTGLLRFPSGS